MAVMSSSHAGSILVRIVEEELIAVGIVDYQETIAPRTFFDHNSPGLEFGAECIQCGDRAFACRRLDIQGNEHQPLADFLRPSVGQDERASLAIDLRDMHPAVLFVAPRTRESEAINIEPEG